ncbi:MAG: OadG family protein [Victivallaceae bacterium]
MSNWELFLDGLKLLVFGMGTVYAFLTLMVFCMKGLQIAVRPFTHLLEAPVAAAPAPKAAPAEDTAAVAAAVAAVELYRKNHQ